MQCFAIEAGRRVRNGVVIGPGDAAADRNGRFGWVVRKILDLDRKGFRGRVGTGACGRRALLCRSRAGCARAGWFDEMDRYPGLVAFGTEPGDTGVLGIVQLTQANDELGFFFFNNWISINNDPFYHLYWLFWSPCCNYTNYSNPDVHQLIEEYTLSTDQEARDQASLDAQQAIVDDAPWVFLYQPDFLLAMRSNVKGYVFYSTDRFTRYKSLYKE